MPRSAIVVGAGLCGLVAADGLARAGISTTVLDKGRAPGGRLSTRRDGDARWDHGAQFFTVRDPRFGKTVEEWCASGVATEWCRGFGGASDGHPRFRGTPGMSAIGRHLARDLDVRTGVRVASITPVVPGGAGEWVESIGGSGAHSPETRWRVALEATEGDDRAEPRAIEADALLLTAPVPQSLALLDAGATALSPTDRAALDRVSYEPCIAVLAELDGPSRLPPPGALDPGSEPIGWISDDLAKGVSSTPTATIHATARWSALHFERDREESARELLQAAAPMLGVGVRGYRVHGWRFARPSVLHEGPCRVARDLPPLVFAGDAFVAPRVEGAFLSGLAAVEALLERMSPGRST